MSHQIALVKFYNISCDNYECYNNEYIIKSITDYETVSDEDFELLKSKAGQDKFGGYGIIEKFTNQKEIIENTVKAILSDVKVKTEKEKELEKIIKDKQKEKEEKRKQKEEKKKLEKFLKLKTELESIGKI